MAKAKIKRLYLIPILSKALDVLELLENNHDPVALEDVYRKTHISKTSVYRILKTFVHRGYVAQSQNGLYRLVSRPRRLRFGLSVQSAELPFSIAVAQSVTAAAAASGVELLVLDNRYDPDVAVRNAEEFVAKRVDLVLEFQVEEHVAPRVSHIFKKADIPLVAIDVPHPNATYFGVDNFECGVEAGALLAQHARKRRIHRIDFVPMLLHVRRHIMARLARILRQPNHRNCPSPSIAQHFIDRFRLIHSNAPFLLATDHYSPHAPNNRRSTISSLT